VPLFSQLPSKALDALACLTEVRQFHEGAVLCYEGDPGYHLMILEEGQLRVSRFTSTGREVILAIVESPAVVGELALIDGQPRSATVTVQRSARVRLLARTHFVRMIREEPAVTEALLHTLADLVRAGNERHLDVLGLDATERLAKWLLVRAAAKGILSPSGTVIALERTQNQLAQELGMSRVWLNQCLKDFELHGLIRVERDHIILLDPESMACIVS
jgi:CRP-like cAMP-binding protein